MDFLLAFGMDLCIVCQRSAFQLVIDGNQFSVGLYFADLRGKWSQSKIYGAPDAQNPAVIRVKINWICSGARLNWAIIFLSPVPLE